MAGLTVRDPSCIWVALISENLNDTVLRFVFIIEEKKLKLFVIPFI